MIYKTKEFYSLTKKENLTDADLVKACTEISQGLVDADLGGCLYKKRVATRNKGKSVGFRTLIGAVIGEKYFFLYAFSKNKRANISHQEKLVLRELAQTFVHFDLKTLDYLIATGELIKVDDCQEGDHHE